MGLEASFCQGIRRCWKVSFSPRPCTHQRPLSCQRKRSGWSLPFYLSVSGGEDGRQSAIVHDVRSRGSLTARHNVFVGHLQEEKGSTRIPWEDNTTKGPPQSDRPVGLHPNRNQKVTAHLRTQCPPQNRRRTKTLRWKQSWMSPSPRLSSMLLRADSQAGLPSST